MLDELSKYNILGRADACSRYLEAQFVINPDAIENIISSIPLTSRERFISNFNEIISESFIAYTHPELSLEFAIAIYDALDANCFISIANKLSENPYEYRNGWPDLTLIKGSNVLFIEVKVRDKLHESQIITIPEIQKIVPASFCICKLLRVN
jgi:uncharacterized protein (UPF0262 family)